MYVTGWVHCVLVWLYAYRLCVEVNLKRGFISEDAHNGFHDTDSLWDRGGGTESTLNIPCCSDPQ